MHLLLMSFGPILSLAHTHSLMTLLSVVAADCVVQVLRQEKGIQQGVFTLEG